MYSRTHYVLSQGCTHICTHVLTMYSQCTHVLTMYSVEDVLTEAGEQLPAADHVVECLGLVHGTRQQAGPGVHDGGTARLAAETPVASGACNSCLLYTSDAADE